MTKRFPIRLDPVWRIPLLAIGARPASSHVEVGDGLVKLRFGLYKAEVPRDDIAGAVHQPWPWYQGIGIRLGPHGIGLIGSTEGVVQVHLRQPLPFTVLPGVKMSFDGFYVSLADPDAFIAEMQPSAI